MISQRIEQKQHLYVLAKQKEENYMTAAIVSQTTKRLKTGVLDKKHG